LIDQRHRETVRVVAQAEPCGDGLRAEDLKNAGEALL
jgi:hypothetical protein